MPARPFTRSPNAGRTGLKQVNVLAVATALMIGVASLHALSGMCGCSTRTRAAMITGLCL